MPTLNLEVKILGFDAPQGSSNPKRRSPDWLRSIAGMPTGVVPQVQPVSVPGLGSVTVFDGSRSLTANGSTAYSVAPVSGQASRYRVAWTGAGAAPGFRTDRGLTLSGGDLTFTLNANQTVTLAHTAGAVFGAVQVGDVVFVPGLSTGDTALFDPQNEGEWSVLAASASSLTLVRFPGTVFQGATETKTVASNGQVLAYSSAGVQPGDVLDISAGFAATSRHAYQVLFAAAGFLEFASTAPLAPETAVPGVSGLKVYSAARSFVYVEADQEMAVRMNGATDDTQRLEPVVAGDPNFPGVYLKIGTCYTLTLVNRSTTAARGVVIASAVDGG